MFHRRSFWARAGQDWPRAGRGRTGGKPGLDPFDFPRKPQRAGKTRNARRPHNRPPRRRRRL